MILRFASNNAIRDLDLNDERNSENLSNGNTLKRDNVILFYLMCHHKMSETYTSDNKLFMLAIHFFCWFLLVLNIRNKIFIRYVVYNIHIE